MPTPSIADYLKYANLQMAAEALYDFNATPPGTNLTPGALFSGPILDRYLTLGNVHASKFSETQASKFVAQWTVEQHISNTSTGFSGTLFKALKDDVTQNIKAGDLVLSFRSTEFVDDAARDNQATNLLEIKDKGFAFGQLSDMEQWYQSLKSAGKITGPLTVTGYSLGGQLATAFNLMHGADVQQVITFNGAGLGKIGDGSLATTKQQLLPMINRFRELRTQGNAIVGLEDEFLSAQGKATYRALKEALAAKNGVPNKSLADIVNSMKSTGQILEGNAKADFDLLDSALLRALSVVDEAHRAPTLASGDKEGPPNPANIRDIAPDGTLAIAAESLDYQIALLITAAQYDVAALSLLAGLNGALGGRTLGIGAPLDNQWDLAGTEMDTDNPLFMVAHSQYRYGQEFQLFIEDQPLTRGKAVSEALKASFSNFAIKLLVPNYAQNNFGDTHSLVLIVDSLNLQNTLLQLIPEAERAAATVTLNNILKAASYLKAERISDSQGIAEGDVLENVANTLADFILGPGKHAYLRGSPVGNTWALTTDFQDARQNYTGRDTFFQLLAQIAESPVFTALAGKLSLNAVSGNITSAARQDFGIFAALYCLSPFVLSAGQNESLLEQLVQGAWGDTFSAWLADKAVATADQGSGAFQISASWLVSCSVNNWHMYCFGFRYLSNRRYRNADGTSEGRIGADTGGTRTAAIDGALALDSGGVGRESAHRAVVRSG